MSLSFLQSKHFKAILSLFVMLLAFVSMTAFAAWSGPTSASDNRAPFLNLGPVTQTKTGRLNITAGNQVLGSAKFEVAGPAMLAGGLNAAGNGSNTSALVLGDVYVGYVGSPSSAPTDNPAGSHAYDLYGNVTVSNDIKAQNLAHGNTGDLEAVCTTEGGWLIPCGAEIPLPATTEVCGDPNALNWEGPYMALSNIAFNNDLCEYPTGKVVYSRPSSSRANSVTQQLTLVSGSCPGCTDSTFVVPEGIQKINIEGYGAGGGGGTSNANINPVSNRGLGGSGQSGAYVRIMDIPIVGGEAFDITIGRGGSGGTNDCNFEQMPDIVPPDVDGGSLGGSLGNSWDMFSCEDYSLEQGEWDSELTILEGAGQLIRIPGGASANSSSSCSGGSGGQGAASPTVTSSGGTVFQQPGNQGFSGASCEAIPLTSSMRTASPSCQPSQLGLNFGFSYCSGGRSSTRLNVTGAFGSVRPEPGQDGDPGLIIISW